MTSGSPQPRPGRVEIVATDLTHKKAGDNPHLWYDPATMPVVATALTLALSKTDPATPTNFGAAQRLHRLAPTDRREDRRGAGEVRRRR